MVITELLLNLTFYMKKNRKQKLSKTNLQGVFLNALDARNPKMTLKIFFGMVITELLLILTFYMKKIENKNSPKLTYRGCF